MAAIVGLRAVREPSVITLYSDSQYLIKTLTLG
jgi:ribonuclease HI